MFYHEKKEDAFAAVDAARKESDAVMSAQVQFEPYNGHCGVLYLTHRVRTLEDRFLCFLGDKQLNTGPERIRPEPLTAEPVAAKGGVKAPRRGGGATARVHSIADDLHSKTPLTRADRAKVIDACVAAGINKSTAATQWSKWAKINQIN